LLTYASHGSPVGVYRCALVAGAILVPGKHHYDERLLADWAQIKARRVAAGEMVDP
jgi:hypothetical protein